MFEHEPWWQFLDPIQRELLKQSYYLLDWAKNHSEKFHDYSFVVMPGAKAFEGYVKKLLYTLKLINEEEYQQDRFRLGKALNPELEGRFPADCLYNEVGRACNPQLAENLWLCWKKCRNQLIHYFPGQRQIFTLEECEERFNFLIETIRQSYTDCKINIKKEIEDEQK